MFPWGAVAGGGPSLHDVIRDNAIQRPRMEPGGWGGGRGTPVAEPHVRPSRGDLSKETAEVWGRRAEEVLQQPDGGDRGSPPNPDAVGDGGTEEAPPVDAGTGDRRA